MPRNWTDFTSTVGVRPRLLNNPEAGGEFAGTLDENGALTHSTTWLVDVRDLLPFLNFVWGWSTLTSTANGQTQTTTTRGPRLASPFLPGLVATSATFGGKPASVRISDATPWGWAVVTVNFGWLPFGTDGSQPYLSVRWRGSSNLITVPNTNSKFAGNNEIIDFDSGLMIGSVGVEVTLHQLINWGPSLATVMGLMGQVNSAAVTLDGFQFAAGQLLLPTFDADKSIATAGSPQQTLTVPLMYRGIPWNSGVRSDGTVDAIVMANGKPPYGSADFSALGNLS